MRAINLLTICCRLHIYIFEIILKTFCKLTSKFLILGTHEALHYVQLGFSVRCEYLHDVCFIFGVFNVPFVKFSLIWICHIMKYWLNIKALELYLVRNYRIQKNWIMSVSKLILSSARRYRAYATVYKNE